MKNFLDFLKVVAVAAAAIGGAAYGSYYLYAYFNPKYEQVRRDTFESSQAYNDGMIRELNEARLNYASASPEGKQAIRAMIRHDFAGYQNRDRLPSEARSFLAEMEGTN
jgi:hypothetical protein